MEVGELSWDWDAGLTPARRTEQMRALQFAAALRKSLPVNREPQSSDCPIEDPVMGRGGPGLCLRAA